MYARDFMRLPNMSTWDFVPQEALETAVTSAICDCHSYNFELPIQVGRLCYGDVLSLEEPLEEHSQHLEECVSCTIQSKGIERIERSDSSDSD